jgi:ankyrin repeat protein
MEGKMKYYISILLVLFTASLIFAADSVLPEDLIRAVYDNDLAVIQKAVANEPSIVQMKNSYSQTLLSIASSVGKKDIVKFLLDSGSDIEARDGMSRTPLITAARETGGIEVIKLLVEKGASINAVDRAEDSALTLAAWRGFDDIVDYLLSKGADVPVNNDKGSWLLSLAAGKGLERLFDVMAVKGADLGIKVEDNATLLHKACEGGSIKIINTLLAADPNVKIPDADGWTPLHYAAFKGRIEVIKLLLKQGADINAKNMRGESPLNIASAWGTEETVSFLKKQGADDAPAKFPKLTGPYFGMPEPGDTPVLFGAGVVLNHFRPHSSIAFSPDGREAFWSLMIPPKEKGYSTGALMHSKMVNGTWTYPVPIRFEKTGIDMDVPFFSFDGNTLYFISDVPTSPGGEGKERIWSSRRQGDSWGEPEPFDETVNSLPIHWQFSFDRQGNLYCGQWGTMYFVGHSDGKFAKPKQLNAALGKEKLIGDTPFIAPDGSYLIYSGSPDETPNQDLFIMFKKKDGTWTDPVNMGESVNTPTYEICPIVTKDGKYLFYSSNFKFMWVKTDIIEKLRKSTLKE